MRHEITQSEADAIRKDRAKVAEQAKREREKRELDEYLSAMELRYGTQ